jgi:cell division protein FtsL
MIRPSTAVWLAIVFCVGFVMFKVKYEVQDLDDKLAKVNREIAAEQDAIHVLKAEWSFLAQPNRLTELARRHLSLAPISTAQLGTLDQLQQIPMRPAAAPAVAAIPPSPALPAAGLRAAPVPALAGSSTAVAQAKTRTLR